MVDLKDLILIFTGLLDLVLGFLVILRNFKSPMNRSFAFFSFSLAGWALGIALFRLSTETTWSLIWAKEYYIAASFIAASLLYFATVFPEKKALSTKLKFLIIAPSMLHALVISIPGYLTHGLVIHEWGKEIILGKVEYSIYTLYFLPFFYGALYILWSKYKKYSGAIRSQVLFLFFSVLIASIFGVIFNLFLPWFGNYELIYLGPPFTMIIAWLSAYAILRHRLWDFRLVFTRVIAHTVLISIIAGAYSFFLFFLSSQLLNNLTKNTQLIFGAIFTFFIVLLFQPLKASIEKFTDALLYKGHYDSNQLLSQMGNIMSTTLELKPLAIQILQILTTEMRVSGAAFLLLEKDSIYDLISTGNPSHWNFSYQQILPILAKEETVIFDELEEGQLKQLLRQEKIAISRVLMVKDEAIGLLLLSDKSSGEIYSDQDLKVINILAPEVAVAIQNSKSYDKIKRFNVTLTEEVKKATVDLQHANSRLKELDKLKDDFVSIASHELRTPMTAIRSYVWMALNKSDVTLSEKMKRYLSRTLISTERLINLVNDMLNVSRIEGGRIEIDPKPVDLIALAGEVIDEVRAKADEKEVKLFVLNHPNIPKVFADADKVHEVFLNLIGNSLKFTPAEGNITVDFFSDGQVVEVRIKDTGIGISKDDLSHLFQKFGRLENSYVSIGTSGGTGLGLYISKNLIELMHGKIWAVSEGVGSGATFTFSLPVASVGVLKDGEKYHIRPVGEAKELEPAAV